eukprot:CAMPEP_0116010886 /NCGR_PEP_ID=MMETSP0321-20121206/4253_1 /TAXON_ID=163516 /ORGANISM="Leptocylindrus danicus var. danicus, Strain B650" /LENGTH=93 /DNA_ID=CAMNT_0003480041 /DNA_START=260 /DNA_END=538 /DNA_ORIENTATION=-
MTDDNAPKAPKRPMLGKAKEMGDLFEEKFSDENVLAVQLQNTTKRDVRRLSGSKVRLENEIEELAATGEEEIERHLLLKFSNVQHSSDSNFCG